MPEVSDSSEALDGRVRGLMPGLVDDLKELMAIPSVSAPGYPEATRAALGQAQDLVTRLFRDCGVERLGTIDLPETAPVVYGEISAPPGAPTVLMYSHYDVVPAGDESLWETPPFEPTLRDGVIVGRGAADTKSNILALAGALRAWDGRPPVGIKVVVEGQEEVGGGAFTTYPKANPDRFASDVMIIADMGNVRPGVPTLTVGLRGMADVVVEARTLASAKHSGLYGGAAPDALLALLRALSTLHDDNGDVAVAGLLRDDSLGAGPQEAELRMLAEVLDGVPLIGTGSLGSRVWSGPAITVTGIDVPSVDDALNAVAPYARAKLNVRVHPGQDPAQAQQAVLRHLREAMPFGIALAAQPLATGAGFAANSDSPVYEAARAAWSQAWGAPVVLAGAGGSIPVVNSLAAGAPAADVLLVGTADGYANIHGPNERVVIDELARSTLAIADLLGRLADLPPVPAR
jgi:acetylornithine deacetylase/succinyl-diaminopimelate desuccinylase-like protein